MNTPEKLLVFRLGEQRYAAALEKVIRVVSAVEVTVLPNVPAIVFGVIDVAGAVIPVLNLRRRFGLAESEIVPASQFLIVKTRRRQVALVIDQALDVIEKPTQGIIAATQVVPGVEQVQGLIKLPDGLVLMHDLEKLLSLDENQGLDEALKRETARAT